MSEVKTITLHNSSELYLYDKEPMLTNFGILKPDGSKIEITKTLGKLSEITEEQIVDNDLVEGNNGGVNDTMWKNYEYPKDYFFCFEKRSRKESLLSLLQVNNIDTSKEWVLILKK